MDNPIVYSREYHRYGIEFLFVSFSLPNLDESF